MAKRELIDKEEVKDVLGGTINSEGDYRHALRLLDGLSAKTEQDIVKPILDKIRAEIVKKHLSVIEKNDFESGRTYGYEEVLDIIDKYKTESEVDKMSIIFPKQPTIPPMPEPKGANEKVNHPKHYNQPGKKECIDEMVELFGLQATLNFCWLNCYKYLYRAGQKEGNSKEQDIKKADWYLNWANKHERQLITLSTSSILGEMLQDAYEKITT